MRRQAVVAKRHRFILHEFSSGKFIPWVWCRFGFENPPYPSPDGEPDQTGSRQNSDEPFRLNRAGTDLTKDSHVRAALKLIVAWTFASLFT